MKSFRAQDGLFLSFLGFLVNGMFVNMEYYDLPYHWIAVVASLKIIVDREVSEAATADSFGVDDQVLVVAT